MSKTAKTTANPIVTFFQSLQLGPHITAATVQRIDHWQQQLQALYQYVDQILVYPLETAGTHVTHLQQAVQLLEGRLSYQTYMYTIIVDDLTFQVIPIGTLDHGRSFKCHLRVNDYGLYLLYNGKSGRSTNHWQLLDPKTTTAPQPFNEANLVKTLQALTNDGQLN